MLCRDFTSRKETGHGKPIPNGMRLIQDGSKWAGRFSLALANRLNRMIGAKYQQFLDNIQAYFYFPLAIAKDGFVSNGMVSAGVMPVAGLIDQAGGIAFGIQNIGNYFVFRLNSLEDNLILFEYVNSRRIERQSVTRPLEDRSMVSVESSYRRSTIDRLHR